VEELPLGKPKKVEAGNKCPTSQALKKVKSCKISSQVTSLTRMNREKLLLGTKGGDIYTLSAASFKDLILNTTSHPSSISSIAIPKLNSTIIIQAKI